MTHKDLISYTALLQHLKEKATELGEELNPDNVITDFEASIRNAVSAIFPQASRRYCFFHLKKIVWRKMESLGLKKRYSQNKKFASFIKQMCALAFLPPNEIPEAFNVIKNRKISHSKIMKKFFEDNYIRGKIAGPENWSVCDQILLSLPRTTNHVESWHRRIKIIIGNSHMHLPNIIDQLRKEHRESMRKILMVQQGIEVRRRLTYVKRDKRLLNVITNRDPDDTKTFLKSISFLIRDD
jgi:hypothetical protein